MSGISKRVSGSWVSGDYGIMKTATDTITTLPAVLYPNAVTATVGLKGNMEQSGTPSPTTPIQPQECGERTGNLFDLESWLISNGAVFSKDGNAYTFSAVQSMFSTSFYFSDTDIPVSISGIMTGITAYNVRINLIRADGTTAKAYAVATNVTKSENIVCAGLNFDWSRPGTMRIDSLMLNLGSTPLPYEPYGYKIPISSASTTTPVYLGEVESTRQIKELVLTGNETIEGYDSTYNRFSIIIPDSLIIGVRLSPVICSHYQAISDGRGIANVPNNAIYSDSGTSRWFIKTTEYTNTTDFKAYLAAQYAAGTPVTVWYVLATPTTGIVNEPIRKIGDYADTVLGITIPTIAGANTLSVDTTLQPSEVTANYHGWHTGAVHERENGQWD